ncbi:CobW domain-containing protein [Hygrophoropsis aurantiaca]|uniref:CobW domain-containing protein n=1 Tax=Hygrophoropsis aurantiaca TaxID=72124 RepID=A0ACB8AC63_9AGAM|nr:CobW domain-containing protein [Hygrophoropsis aurantiaca]
MDSDDDIPTLIDPQEAPSLSNESATPSARLVPCTILTGFLGAGKSTLLKRILTERHGYRIAVIMNEFGDTANIEAKTINVSSPEDPTAEKSEEFLELANGCLCCSIKDVGIAAIEKLMERKGAFDHILLETTGLADPGPIASMLWHNEEYASGLGRDIVLDGVVCVVDAIYGLQQMEEDHSVDGIGESLRQIACSDVILLNKIDLAKDSLVDLTEKMIRKVNSSAPIFRTIQGQVQLEHILDINAYANASQLHTVVSAPHNHAHTHDYDDEGHDRTATASTHYELRGISSLQVSVPTLNKTRFDALDAWIRSVLWEQCLPDHASNPEGNKTCDLKVLRCKGLFIMESGEQLVLQGVQDRYNIAPVDDQNITGVPEIGKLVLIGKGLNEKVRQNLMMLWE